MCAWFVVNCAWMCSKRMPWVFHSFQAAGHCRTVYLALYVHSTLKEIWFLSIFPQSKQADIWMISPNDQITERVDLIRMVQWLYLAVATFASGLWSAINGLMEAKMQETCKTLIWPRLHSSESLWVLNAGFHPCKNNLTKVLDGHSYTARFIFGIFCWWYDYWKCSYCYSISLILHWFHSIVETRGFRIWISDSGQN